MSRFIKGLDLCESFFKEIAKPILDREFPTLKYSAALIGYGSDVIGLDTEVSMDHMWGPRFNLYLEHEDFHEVHKRISTLFSKEFPYEYYGYTTNFSQPDPQDSGVRHPVKKKEGSISHLVEFHTLASFFGNYLGYKPEEDITESQWLTFPEHRLLAVTAGRVFHDELGLQSIRDKLAFYPDDIWFYLMSSQWAMISEEEAFVGRCGHVDDDLGSRIITHRIINHLMRLCFLMERRYAPYSKWFGSAFKTLDISQKLLPVLENVSLASCWEQRQKYLSEAYLIVAEKHNSIGITPYIKPDIKSYYGRPYLVMYAGVFTDELSRCIQSESLRVKVKIGSVAHLTDVSAINDELELCNMLKVLYQ